MGVFDDVELPWKDRTHILPARKMMGAVARIEDVLTLRELAAFEGRRTVPVGRYAQAYGAVLRYAGVPVTDEDVYAVMHADEAGMTAVTDAVNHLMLMMLPPEQRRKALEAAAAAAAPAATEDQTAGNSQPAAASS